MIWLAVAAYAFGWILSTPGALRRIMLKEVCILCLTEDASVRDSHTTYFDGETRGYRRRHSYKVPRGSVHERDGWYVTGAAFLALAWPVRLAWAAVTKLLYLAGHGAAQAVIRSTALTPPELERRIKSQKAEIDRLTDEMKETP